MNVIFTCGGTGGHIMPAIAVANIWKEKHPDSKILFIGGKDNMEEELVPKAGYELITLPAFGMARGLSLKAIKRNLLVFRSVLEGFRACKKIIREFKPDVIVGTGGYASFPALFMGSRMGIPTCVHEANAMPGRTTRMVADRASRVLCCFPESAKYYRDPQKVQVVGMPVRREFLYTGKEEARAELGLDSRPVVVSAFGSQGARAMNEMIAELLVLEKNVGYPFQHIHAIGSYGMDWMPQLVKEKGVDVESSNAITMQEYIYNMPTVMAAADVFISRAGASTCNEIAASGTPCILIPSPNVTDNHQEKNARAVERQGGAIVMTEAECTPQAVMDQLTRLLSDKQRCDGMSRALKNMVIPDSAERVCGVMEELIRSKE